MVDLFKKHQKIILIIIFVQYWLATAGSLFYSTYGDPVNNIIEEGTLIGVGLVPCTLCWFARILMYPGLFISFVGFIKNDKLFTDYTFALSLPGIALEIYHYSIQKLSIANNFSCSAANPCDALNVDYFGFITIPFLCLVAFIITGGLSFINSYIQRDISQRKNFLKASGIYLVLCIVFLIGLYIV